MIALADAIERYRSQLRGASDATWLLRPHPGDLVLETSSWDDGDDRRLGHLVRFQTVEYVVDGQRIIEHQALLELADGRRLTWGNCSFARIEEPAGPCVVVHCPYCAAAGSPGNAPGGDWNP